MDKVCACLCGYYKVYSINELKEYTFTVRTYFLAPDMKEQVS